jgi:hypothetical protein
MFEIDFLLHPYNENWLRFKEKGCTHWKLLFASLCQNVDGK